MDENQLEEGETLSDEEPQAPPPHDSLKRKREAPPASAVSAKVARHSLMHPPSSLSPSLASPASTPASLSAYSSAASLRRPEPRKFRGTAKIEDYETKVKIGEGTFGVRGLSQGYRRKGRPEEDPHAQRKGRGMSVSFQKFILTSSQLPITALREIKILKALDHPNIIPLTEIAYQRGKVVDCSPHHPCLKALYEQLMLRKLLELSSWSFPTWITISVVF
ncbi:serine/threonine protein kinase, CMGC, CDC2/CDK sub [Nowakowskiella sp. JEL0078]|nr:serine/threonine protein kinase, CMGC, CDC2/CDK sub [Nowakowskiella sp. JEL0078]